MLSTSIHSYSSFIKCLTWLDYVDRMSNTVNVREFEEIIVLRVVHYRDY